MTLSSNSKEKHIFSTNFRVKRGPHIKLETGKETLNKLTQHKSLTNPEEVHPKKNGKRFEQHRGNIMEPYFIYIIIRDYYMTFSISALVLARDSHIKPDSETGGLIWVEG